MLWILGAGLALPLMAIASELACRWWLRRDARYCVWPPGARIEIRTDPEVFPELERRVRFDINPDGERGGEVPHGEGGLYRILVAGGSAVECFALDQPTSWPGALERLLNAPSALQALGAGRVHVGNIGHSGVGSGDLDVILERVLPQYPRLNAIIVMVGASDVYRWLEEGAPATRAARPVLEEQLFTRHPNPSFAWTPAGSALAEAARRVRRALLHPIEVKERAGAWFREARRMRAAAQEVRTEMPDATVVLEHFGDNLRRLLRRAGAHADRVLVARQPWFEGAYTAEEVSRFWHGGAGRPWRETVTVYYDLEVVNRVLGRVDARAAQVAEALGIPHVNLRPLLTQRLAHYYDHDHYTPAGAAAVAQGIAAALLRRPSSTAGGGERPPRSSGAQPMVASGRSRGR